MITPDVVKVTPLAGYCVEAMFANGERRKFDMKPYLDYPAFAPLAENNFFMKAHIEHGTVVWNDDIDLPLDTLYLRGLPIA